MPNKQLTTTDVYDNGRGRTRTCNPRFRRPMLYPIELRALFFVRRGPSPRARLDEFQDSSLAQPVTLRKLTLNQHEAHLRVRGGDRLRVSLKDTHE